MTGYTKQTWVDNDQSKPLSAVRMAHLEDGIGGAYDALATKAGTVGRVNVVAVSGSAQTLPDPSVSVDTRMILTADCAVTLPSGFTDETGAPGSAVLTLLATQDATGHHALTVTNAITYLPDNTPPTIAPTGVTLLAYETFDGGSTWIGSGNAAASVASLVTAKGDLLIGTGPGAVTRLAAGTTAGALLTDGAGNWSIGAQVLPGTELAAPVSFNPTAAQTDATTTATSPADVATAAIAATWSGVNANTFDITFTAPAGITAVVYRLAAFTKGSGTIQTRFGIYDLDASAVVANSQFAVSGGSQQNRCLYEKRVPVTPGQTYHWRPQWCVSSGTGTISVGGVNGSLRIAVFASL